MVTQAQTGWVRVLRALHDIAVAVGGVLEPVELARVVVERTRELLEAGAVGLYVFDEGQAVLHPIYSSDARAGEAEPDLAPGIGAAGQAFERGEPVLVDDYPAWPHAGHWAAANGVQSAMAVPLLLNERRTGAISVRAYSARHWTEDDAEALTLLAAQVAPALETALLYERTQAAREQAEAAIRLRDEVLAGVSHDLAGPLARIRLYAELIHADAPSLQPLDSAQQLGAWSMRIVSATASMKSIIQDLVDVARLQMGQALSLDLRPTDLVGVVRRALADRQQSGRPMRLNTSLEQLVGWWDEARIARVLGNLLDNALKYSPDHTEVLVTLGVAQHEAGGWAVLRVSDAGPGIPAADLPHVFRHFYRGSNANGRAGGSGLGLAIARQIAEQHGGRVEIESEPGRGTTVSLHLPRSGPVEAAEPLPGERA